jgi:hypothetical protein
LSALAVFISAPAFTEVLTVQSRKASLPIRLDGQADEWAADGLILDTKSGSEFAFQNDGRNLYILCVVKKSKSVKSVESTGMTVLGRHGGTKKPARGVLFLTRDVSADGYILWRESQGALMTEAEKTEVRKAGRQELYLAFAVEEKGSTYGPLRRQKESEPPDFGFSREAAGATYEFKIPLAPPDLVPGGIGALPGETIRISFDWGGADKKILSAKATRETPPSEKGELSGSGGTWAQEFLDTFDSMSRPTLGTKKYAFAVDVKLAEIK